MPVGPLCEPQKHLASCAARFGVVERVITKEVREGTSTTGEQETGSLQIYTMAQILRQKNLWFKSPTVHHNRVRCPQEGLEAAILAAILSFTSVNKVPR